MNSPFNKREENKMSTNLWNSVHKSETPISVDEGIKPHRIIIEGAKVIISLPIWGAFIVFVYILIKNL